MFECAGPRGTNEHKLSFPFVLFVSGCELNCVCLRLILLFLFDDICHEHKLSFHFFDFC